MSSRPAEIFGIPWKGRIDVGYDADIFFIDPKKKKKIKADMLHSAADYTPFEGMNVTGFPTLTMLRGSVIIREENFMANLVSGDTSSGSAQLEDRRLWIWRYRLRASVIGLQYY